MNDFIVGLHATIPVDYCGGGVDVKLLPLTGLVISVDSVIMIVDRGYSKQQHTTFVDLLSENGRIYHLNLAYLTIDYNAAVTKLFISK